MSDVKQISIHEQKKNLGRNLTYLRKKFKLSHKHLADLLKTTPETVKEIENGIWSDKFDVIIWVNICKLFRYSPDSTIRPFLGDEEYDVLL